MPPSELADIQLPPNRTFTIFKVLAIAVWTLLITTTYAYALHHGLTIMELFNAIITFLSQHPWAPVIYVVVYMVQPFALLPSTIFSILAGTIFGFWEGFAYTMIGGTLSAALVYLTGRFLSHQVRLPAIIKRFARPLHTEPFLTVLFMRLAYFPFDVVNLSTGLLSVRFQPFIYATALGTIPGIATLTALGASFSAEEFLEHGFSLQALDLRTLILSAGLFVISLIIVKVVRPYISLKK